MLAPGAIIVCDDYSCEDPNVKQLPVQDFVHDMIRSGILRDLGFYKWGTWFGQYVGA
jgi:hypothetical protein